MPCACDSPLEKGSSYNTVSDKLDLVQWLRILISYQLIGERVTTNKKARFLGGVAL